MIKHARRTAQSLVELFKAGVYAVFFFVFAARALGDAAPISTHFSYPAPNASSVELAGQFNSWKPAAMTKGADGTWTADVPLAPGEYGYKFIVDGKDWEFDPGNPTRKTVDGIENSSITVPAAGGAAAATPGSAGISAAPAAPAAGLEAAVFSYSNPSAGSVFVAGQFNGWNTSATPLVKDASGTWTVTLQMAPGSYQYKLFVDGSWMVDPANDQQVDDGTGNMNSLKVVGGGGAAAQTASAPAEDPMLLGGVHINSNDTAHFDIPLPAETWRQTFLKLPVAHGEPRMADDMRVKASQVHVALLVPQDFKPDQKWPLLIVCGAQGSSSKDEMDGYSAVAAQEGWVTLAADVAADHSSDSNLIRWAGLAATLSYLHTKWPASKEWPVAVAGFDGGAWKAGYTASLLVRQGYNLIGIWLGGVYDESASKGMHEYNPPHGKYLHTPVYVSSGKTDKQTPPEKSKAAVRSLESAGFQKPKLGVFAGDHEVDPEQVKEGLDWFADTAKGHAAAAADSSPETSGSMP